MKHAGHPEIPHLQTRRMGLLQVAGLAVVAHDRSFIRVLIEGHPRVPQNEVIVVVHHAEVVGG